MDFERESEFIWSQDEAILKAVNEIANLSYARSAVINALASLGEHINITSSNEEQVLKPPESTSESNNTTTSSEEDELMSTDSSCKALVEYLFYRSELGDVHTSVISTIKKLSNGMITGKFFPTFPLLAVHLENWLVHWMRKGATPIICFNGQRGVERDRVTQESWAYQMVYGVGPAGVYVCSPIKCISPTVLREQLNSPSELIIDRDEVVSRWNPETDLSQLLNPRDYSWKKYNVLGQVVNIIREVNSWKNLNDIKNSVTIPVVYEAGVILVMRKDNPNYFEFITYKDDSLKNPCELIITMEKYNFCSR